MLLFLTMEIPPPYSYKDTNDKEDDSMDFMTELRNIYDSHQQELIKHINNVIESHFPTKKALKISAKHVNYLVLYRTKHTDSINIMVTNFELYTKNYNKNISEYATFVYDKISPGVEFTVSVSKESYIDVKTKIITTAYILNCYEDLCKKYKYTYKRDDSSIRIIW